MKELSAAWKSDKLWGALAFCWLLTVASSFFGPYLLPVPVPLVGTLYPFRVLLPVTALLYLVWAIRRKDAFWRDVSALEKWCWVLIASMILYGAASLFRAIDLGWTFSRLFNLCFDLCFFFLMLRLCRNKQLFRATLLVCGVVLALLCLVGVYEIFFGGVFNDRYDDHLRIFLFTRLLQYPVGPYYNTNDYACAITFAGALLLLVAGWNWERLKPRHQWLLVTGFALLYFLAVCSTARLVIFSVYILLAGWAVFLLIRDRKRLWLIAVALAAILCVQFVSQYQYIVPPVQRYLEELREHKQQSASTPEDTTPSKPTLVIGDPNKESLSDEIFTVNEETGEKELQEESSGGVRVRLLLHAFGCFVESRGLGVGLGNTERLAFQRHVAGDYSNIHCFVARILADYGVFVLVPLGAICVLLLKRVLAALLEGIRRKSRHLTAVSLLSLFVLAAYPLLSTISSDAQDILAMWIYLAGIVLFSDRLLQLSARSESPAVPVSAE